MNNVNKYTRQYFPAPIKDAKWAEKNYIDKAPIWCSVDLRDGNQALMVPMSLEEKLEFFKLLVDLGFKEIEVGFPAASDTEYKFLRTLIEENLIPDDVTVQVLTQSREHIIKKTFESLRGVKNAIVHLYNSTSVAQREQVFRKSKQEIIDIAVAGAELFNKYNEAEGNKYRFEYSPESFTGTEPEFALEISNAVLDVWKPTADRKAIINLPVTVQVSMPHVYANQVAYMNENLKYRENVIISLHPHNDRGCAVADTEMGILAGANRVEGTLFGNGERTGNVDIITVALNMFSQGVDPELDFTNMPRITEVYERVTRMHVYDRTPYAGKLVFAAFSGSHQDAIAKGMKWREEKNCQHWTVPYLPIDPNDVGREYETDVIRINSQSGKGGIGYLLEQTYGYSLPAAMREHLSYLCKDLSDHEHRELKVSDVLEVFKNSYFKNTEPVQLRHLRFNQTDDGVETRITFIHNGERKEYVFEGNGSLDAVSNALRGMTGKSYKLAVFSQHSMGNSGSESTATAYVGLEWLDGSKTWGAGTHTDIIRAGAEALISAFNNKFINS